MRTEFEVYERQLALREHVGDLKLRLATLREIKASSPQEAVDNNIARIGLQDSIIAELEKVQLLDWVLGGDE